MKNKYRLGFIADVHGNKGQFIASFRHAEQLRLDGIAFGGDIAPKEGNLKDGPHWKPDHKTRTPKVQRIFYKDFMLPLFSRYSQKGMDVFAMMSNDDFRINMDILEKASEEGKFKLIHDKAYELPNGLYIVGTSWIDLTPFVNKDWEKHDLINKKKKDKLEQNLRYEGCIDDGINIVKVDFKKISTTDSLETHLFQKIQPLAPPNKTIYVLHAPPYGTNLDQMIENGKLIHVGSSAIRKYFEEIGGLLGLHGHIHETVIISGHYKDKVGNTLVATPGNDPFNYPTNNYTNYRNIVDILIVELSPEKIDNIYRESIFF